MLPLWLIQLLWCLIFPSAVICSAWSVKWLFKYESMIIRLSLGRGVGFDVFIQQGVSTLAEGKKVEPWTLLFYIKVNARLWCHSFHMCTLDRFGNVFNSLLSFKHSCFIKKKSCVIKIIKQLEYTMCKWLNSYFGLFFSHHDKIITNKLKL